MQERRRARRTDGTAARVVEEHVDGVLDHLRRVAEDEDVDPGEAAGDQLAGRVRERHLGEDDGAEHERPRPIVETRDESG